jgi:hypothetical protein
MRPTASVGGDQIGFPPAADKRLAGFALRFFPVAGSFIRAAACAGTSCGVELVLR